MQRISWLVGAVAVICFFTPVTLLAQETLDNAGVIGLKQAGLGDTVILNKIKASKCNFDISTDALKKLKEGGLSDDVINAIIAAAPQVAIPTPANVTAIVVSSDPNATHEPGIWLYQELGGERRMVKLQPRHVGKKSGWNETSRLVLPGLAATLQLSGNFTFYYYEEPKQAGAFAPTPENADDFTLARFELKREKNVRRLSVGREGFFGGKRSGLDPDQYVQVTIEKIGDGVYHFKTDKALGHGEYCFIRNDDASRDALTRGDVEVYDFGVKK